jgi:hypothetical protein
VRRFASGFAEARKMNVNPQQESNAPATEESTGTSELAYLEQALWKQLAQASTSKAFARAWLTLQCALKT